MSLEIYRRGGEDTHQTVVLDLIAEKIPRKHRKIIAAALSLLKEIEQIPSTVVSPDDSTDEMPRQPQYGAGDISVTLSELPLTKVVVFEVDLILDDECQTMHKTTVSLRLTDEGVKLHKDSSRKVTVNRISSDESSDSLDFMNLEGRQALCFQAWMLRHGAKQLKDDRLRKASQNEHDPETNYYLE